MTEQKHQRERIWIFIVPLAVLSLGIITIVGEVGIGKAKLIGMGLAVLAFLPVFILLARNIGTDSFNTLLIIVVGGFLFKMLIVMIGIWAAVKKFDLPVVDLVVGCIALLLSFQAFEALYFWKKGGKQTETGLE